MLFPSSLPLSLSFPCFLVCMVLSISFVFYWSNQHHGWVFMLLPVFWQKSSISINFWHWPPPNYCRYAVIDISAGPCSYGRRESEEGSVGYRTVPRLQHLLLPRRRSPVVHPSVVKGVFCGQISGLIVSAVEHIIAPDVRYLDSASTCLILVAHCWRWPAGLSRRALKRCTELVWQDSLIKGMMQIGWWLYLLFVVNANLIVLVGVLLEFQEGHRHISFTSVDVWWEKWLRLTFLYLAFFCWQIWDCGCNTTLAGVNNSSTQPSAV